MMGAAHGMAAHRGLAGALLVLVVTGGCGPAVHEETPPRLVVYSAGPRPLAEAICTSFTEETGIPVDLFQATTGQMMARLEAERYRPRADVTLFASEVAAEALKREGRLLPYAPAGADAIHPDWSDPDGAYWGTGATLVGVAFRADLLPAPPESWAEWFRMADARRLVMPSPSRSGAAGDFVVGYALRFPDRDIDGFRELRAAGMDFSAANSQAIGGLLTGAYDAMIGAADYLIYRQIERGEPLAMQYPAEGAVLVIRPIAILATTPRPETARQFVDHYLAEPAQRRVAGAHLIPAHRDVPPSAVRQALPDTWLRADPHEAVRSQSPLLRRFQIEIERAVRVAPVRNRSREAHP